MAAITVLLASATQTRRAACEQLLRGERGIRVVGKARTGLEAVAAAGRLRPDIVLLDVGLYSAHGAPLLKGLRLHSPETRVILLTRLDTQVRILEALSYGARGCLETRMLRRFLAKAVRAVAADEAWVPRKLVARILDRLARLASRPSRRR